MRVLQLGPYPPPHGGVQSNLVAIRAFLRKRGIACAVINITRHRKPEADEVYYPESATRLLWLLLTLRYDILHLHLGGMLTPRLLRLGLACNSVPGRKSVVTFHSGGYPSTPEAKSTGPHSFAGFVLRRFDRVIGVNPEIMEFFGRLRVPPDRACLIYPHAFPSEEKLSGKLLEPLNTFFSQHQPILISVGLLEPEYDLPLQIQVLGPVLEKNPNAGLVIIGSGSLEESLRQKITAQSYAAHILLCGDVPHAATMEATRQADVMLRTTLYDGDAVSVREALHLGVPVIATDNGMRPPGVQLIPKQNLDELQKAIDLVLANPSARSAPSAADESNLQAVLELYQELAGAK